jgi:sugar/nucleoside kinase (ribokinase family)
MIGTGGIGSGSFFALNNNHTLGREESRSGHFLDQKDYCKLHIISHYVQSLLGPSFQTIPVGTVGNDEVGKRLLLEMEDANIDTRHVILSKGRQTLYSFCFLYPDGSGGNLTTDDSACDYVNADFISKAEEEFRRFSVSGIALAVPEVPLSAREKTLELGTKYQLFRVASFSSEEIRAAIANNILQKCDLLAINLDEAARIANTNSDKGNPLRIVETAIAQAIIINPNLWLSITAGKSGSWFWDGANLQHQAAFLATLVSTAGAGDAHLAGVITGLTAGLSFSESHELGALIAGLSVTSPHTIEKTIGRDTLFSFAREQKTPISKAVASLLKD